MSVELRLEAVSKRYRGPNGAPTQAVDGVSFHVRTGETVALVGESGSGKSTLARLITRLEDPSEGTIQLDGVPLGRRPDLPAWIQMIFQDPFSSLNPAHPIGYSIARPIAVKERLSMAAALKRAGEALETVGLRPSASFIGQRVSQLSGGQRQRANIARALALRPRFLVADEPTSMLDVSVGLEILNLLWDLRDREMGLLFITHNLAAARYLSDRVVVLYQGKVMEAGPIEAVIRNPRHPYTRQLVAATPEPGRSLPDLPPVESPQRMPGWCPFAPRCPDRHEGCREPVAVHAIAEEHTVRCTLHRDPNAEGSPL